MGKVKWLPLGIGEYLGSGHKMLLLLTFFISLFVVISGVILVANRTLNTGQTQVSPSPDTLGEVAGVKDVDIPSSPTPAPRLVKSTIKPTPTPNNASGENKPTTTNNNQSTNSNTNNSTNSDPANSTSNSSPSPSPLPTASPSPTPDDTVLSVSFSKNCYRKFENNIWMTHAEITANSNKPLKQAEWQIGSLGSNSDLNGETTVTKSAGSSASVMNLWMKVTDVSGQSSEYKDKVLAGDCAIQE